MCGGRSGVRGVPLNCSYKDSDHIGWEPPHILSSFLFHLPNVHIPQYRELRLAHRDGGRAQFIAQQPFK